MTVLGVLAVLRRRWLVVVEVLLVTAVSLALVHKRPIDYQACASVALIAPRTPDFPNVYDNTQETLVATTGLVTQKLMSTGTQQQFTAAGLTATYQAQVLNTGTDATPLFTEPLTNVCSDSYSALTALNTTNAVLDKFGAVLYSLQASAHVSHRDFITDKIIVPVSTLPILGRPSQALLGVGLIGIILAIAMALLADSIMLRRSGRSPRPRPRWLSNLSAAPGSASGANRGSANPRRHE